MERTPAVQKMIDKLTPREQKALAKSKGTCYIRMPDGSAVKCCTFVDPIGLSEEGTQRIDYIPREEQQKMVQELLMPKFAEAVEMLCSKNPALRDALLRAQERKEV